MLGERVDFAVKLDGAYCILFELKQMGMKIFWVLVCAFRRAHSPDVTELGDLLVCRVCRQKFNNVPNEVWSQKD